MIDVHGQNGASTRDLITHKWASQFTRFPYYRTFYEGPTGIISLTAPQVNALSQFTTYVVEENKDQLLNPRPTN